VEFKTKYEAAWAEGSNLFVLAVGEWKVQKPLVKAAKCCHCGTCYLFCPTGCIEDKGIYFEANLDYCKGCGTCAVECPVMAIAMVRDE
jgi:2-oxoacid:acceptor oxidoreductase delta subunit (pyruvate/2-ketoisovalerate family)